MRFFVAAIVAFFAFPCTGSAVSPCEGNFDFGGVPGHAYSFLQKEQRAVSRGWYGVEEFVTQSLGLRPLTIDLSMRLDVKVRNAGTAFTDYLDDLKIAFTTDRAGLLSLNIDVRTLIKLISHFSPDTYEFSTGYVPESKYFLIDLY